MAPNPRGFFGFHNSPSTVFLYKGEKTRCMEPKPWQVKSKAGSEVPLCRFDSRVPDAYSRRSNQVPASDTECLRALGLRGFEGLGV